MIHSCFQTCPPWLIYFFMQLKHNNLRLEINPFKWEIPLWSLSQVLVDVWHSTTEYSFRYQCWGGFQKSQEATPHWSLCKYKQKIFHLPALGLQMCHHVTQTWPISCELLSLCVQGVHRLFTVVVTKWRFRQHCWKLLWWYQGRHPKYPCLWHHLSV